MPHRGMRSPAHIPLAAREGHVAVTFERVWIHGGHAVERLRRSLDQAGAKPVKTRAGTVKTRAGTKKRRAA